ncbi:MAG: 50S ribosomal protein L21 [Candidatus Saccharibacteria bacterium]|nr:50S ribosomal protein L21 [Candidatus Saccharibacteria bacterium]
MKKAVIRVGSSQYLVSEGDVIEVDLLQSDDKKFSLPALLILDGDKTTVGKPETDSKVELSVEEALIKADKVTAIRYKAKKRVHKTRGHRQKLSSVKVVKIS